MSQETVLPPPRPSGPEEEHSHESSLLLSETHGCDSPSRPPDPKPETGSGAPRGGSAEEARGSSSSSDLIRMQPHPLARPAASTSDPSEGGTRPLQTGPHTELSNGKGAPPGAPHAGAEPVAGGLPRKLQSSLSGHSSGSSSTISSQSHKPGSSPEDCCVHCILACLFCEFLALCNMALSQASCGGCGPDTCCCCCGAEELGEDCACPCDADCGVLDACCESSDCLEICMECCGICFPT
ncbi:myoD family inhibitor domain-containing protein-like isoform X2 [Megalops cyprinoides]|uniref:myoD family inhibitor domain-containing protein-like isoform X2 n=1 Tax=Megalops cyprinoides TaxID=118141 RepID=UPI0018644701|nr:myoD family inhibitor domain-containing protein-like isoform X2 [Megalops cyprinoides]